MRHSKLLLCFSAVAITLSVIIFTAACNKNKNTPEDTGYASDHVVSEQTFNDVQSISDQAATTTGNMAYRTTATTGGPCATVTHSNDTIYINFGQTDCVCKDGRKRRGEIIVTYTGGSYSTVGSVHTVTFNNFYQNDNKVTGYKTVTNMGNNAAGQPYFNIHVEGAVTLDAGGTISAVWDRVRTWTAGYNTPTDFTDDVYEITGLGKLTRANGNVININISKPLVVATSCHWVEAGSITYSFGNKSRVLNYGDTPNCDDLATITLGNGNIRNITLP
jgi:hypothetical protein